jgi:hypothetical protein
MAKWSAPTTTSMAVSLISMASPCLGAKRLVKSVSGRLSVGKDLRLSKSLKESESDLAYLLLITEPPEFLDLAKEDTQTGP